MNNVTTRKFIVSQWFAISQDARAPISRVTRVTFGTRLMYERANPLARPLPAQSGNRRSVEGKPGDGMRQILLFSILSILRLLMYQKELCNRAPKLFESFENSEMRTRMGTTRIVVNSV